MIFLAKVCGMDVQGASDDVLKIIAIDVLLLYYKFDYSIY